MHENLTTRVKVNTRPVGYISWERENSGFAHGVTLGRGAAPGQASRSRAAEQHIMDSTGLLCFACFYLDAFWWFVLFGSVVLFFFSWFWGVHFAFLLLLFCFEKELMVRWVRGRWDERTWERGKI